MSPSVRIALAGLVLTCLPGLPALARAQQPPTVPQGGLPIEVPPRVASGSTCPMPVARPDGESRPAMRVQRPDSASAPAIRRARPECVNPLADRSPAPDTLRRRPVVPLPIPADSVPERVPLHPAPRR